MPVTLNASTSSGLVQTADTSGTVEIQSNGTTKLTVSSSGVNIGQMNGGAITAGTAVTLTNQTVVDFSIPSWVKRITVMLSGVSTNGTSPIFVQLGTGGTPTTSGYNTITATVTTTANTTGASLSTTGFNSGAVTAATVTEGAFVFTNLNSNIWVGTGSTFSSNNRNNNLSGSISLGGVLNLVRVTTQNGTDTFDAGTINLLYEG